MPNPTDEIKQRLDIVDLLSEYIKLNPAGGNFKALCPFHNEKTPSFMVSPEKQIWHCFGCGKGGDQFTFIQEMEGVEFPEALRILAQRAGVKLTYQNPEHHNQKTRLLDLVRTITDYWHELLLKDAESETIRKYLHERQVSSGTFDEFQLGYSRDNWDDAIKFLQGKNFTLKEIADVGLSVTGSKGKPYDRFRGRLIFPIRDVHGNVVGFTARKMKEEDQGGKYVNSPQTAIYNKSAILYNLDLAKQEIKRLGYVILVEGNMDAISSYQSGVKNVIAISGTALTADQINLIKRYTINVKISFDSDMAGTGANLRGIDLLLNEGFNVKVIKISGGKDPDDLIRENPAAWPKAIKEAVNYMDYIFETILKDLDLERVDHKKMAAKKLLPFVKKLGDEVEKNHYLKKLADTLTVSEDSLRTAMTSIKERPQLVSAEKPAQEVSKPVDQKKAVAEQLVGLLIHFPQNIKSVMQNLEPEMLSYQPAVDLYSQLIIYYNKGQSEDEQTLLADLNQSLQSYYNQLSLFVDKEFYQDKPEEVNYEIRQLVDRLKMFYLKDRLAKVSQQLAVAEKKNDQQATDALSREFSELTQQLNLLK